MSMHHLDIIDKSLTNIIHAKRLNTLKQMVNSAFVSESLTVTQLGRALSPNSSEKKQYKKS